MRVLDVVDGVLLRLLGRQVDVDLDRLVVAPGDEVPAGGVDADLLDELLEEDDVAAALRHPLRLPVLDDGDELVDEHLHAVGVEAEQPGRGLQPLDVAVVIGAEDVDGAVEAARELVEHVRDVGRVVEVAAVR